MPPETSDLGDRSAAGAVWLFPGQGAHRPKMAAGLAAAPALFARAAEVLGADLTATCTTDDDPQWDPALLQPALFVVCMAGAQACLRGGARPAAVLGHSFGDFAALTVAEAMSFDDALQLVVLRGEIMARLATEGTGMAAVLGLAPSVVGDVCAEVSREGAVVEVANVNSPTQTIASGHLPALDEVTKRCKALGAFRVRPLRVPYAAHCSLMAPAREEFEVALAGVEVRPPVVPVVSAITCETLGEPSAIRSALARSFAEPVRFADAARAVHREGFRSFCEIGPGSPPRLLGLVRETLEGAGDLRLAVVSSDDDAPDGTPFPTAERPVGGAVRG